MRETFGETGLRVEVLRVIGIYSDPAHTTTTARDGTTTTYIAIAFECRVTGGAPRTIDEAAALDWLDPAHLPNNFNTNIIRAFPMPCAVRRPCSSADSARTSSAGDSAKLVSVVWNRPPRK